MRTLPWYEDRGPNPFLLVTGQAGLQWEQGHFWDWLLFKQLPVLIEPLVKFVQPGRLLLQPRAGQPGCASTSCWSCCGRSCVWAVFGGAITRIATVQVARQEKIGLMEALRFTARKYLSYLSAPLFPLVLVAVLLVLHGDLRLPAHDPALRRHRRRRPAVVADDPGRPGDGRRPGRPGRLAADVRHDQRRGHRQLGGGQPLVQLRLPDALALHLVQPGGAGLRGGHRLLRRLHGLADGLPGQVGRQPDAGHQLGQPRARRILFVYAPTSFGWRTLLLQGNVRGRDSLVVEGGAINRHRLRQAHRQRSGLQRQGADDLVQPGRRRPGVASGWA